MARRHGSKKIDFTQWTFGRSNFSAVSAGTSGQTIITAGTAAATLLRTRGHLLAYLDGVQAPGTLISVSVGMIVMPEGQSTTVVSSPETDGNAPWFFFESFQLGYEEMVVDAVQAPVCPSIRIPIDVKAMRVLRPDREVQLVIENTTILTAAAVNVAVNARFLLGS